MGGAKLDNSKLNEDIRDWGDDSALPSQISKRIDGMIMGTHVVMVRGYLILEE
jgi:hypothetical protein